MLGKPLALSPHHAYLCFNGSASFFRTKFSLHFITSDLISLFIYCTWSLINKKPGRANRLEAALEKGMPWFSAVKYCRVETILYNILCDT